MKTSIITIISLLLASNLAAKNTSAKPSELSWVDAQVEAIKPARVGSKNSYLGSVRDPFVFYSKDKKSKETAKKYTTVKRSTYSSSAYKKAPVVYRGKLSLEAIINKSALISGKWYKEGQMIEGYTIDKVTDRTVLLKRGSKTMVLSTKTKHTSLKFNNN